MEVEGFPPYDNHITEMIKVGKVKHALSGKKGYKNTQTCLE